MTSRKQREKKRIWNLTCIDIYFLLYVALTQCSSIQNTQLITVQTFPGSVDLAGGGLDWAGSLLKHIHLEMRITNICLVKNKRKNPNQNL